jgi:hypothetical protein
MSGRDYIIEFIVQGRYAKVTAVDPATGIEATIVGDANQPQAVLERVAVAKLVWLLKKK